MNRIRIIIFAAATCFFTFPPPQTIQAQLFFWPRTQQPSKASENQHKEEDVAPTNLSIVSKSVVRSRFTAPSEEIADECDKILDRLEERYGKPKVWRSFPVYFRTYTGNGVAGYTMYNGERVTEVVVYESFQNSIGATLDHELTHAFFFYFLNSSFDLFLNEGLAQNCDY